MNNGQIKPKEQLLEETKNNLYKEFADTIAFISKNFELGVGYQKEENFNLALDAIPDINRVVTEMKEIAQKERLSAKGISV